jgi:hypothetical protein
MGSKGGAICAFQLCAFGNNGDHMAAGTAKLTGKLII